MIYRGQLHCRMLSAISQAGSCETYLFNSYLWAFHSLSQWATSADRLAPRKTHTYTGIFQSRILLIVVSRHISTWLQAATFITAFCTRPSDHSSTGFRCSCRLQMHIFQIRWLTAKSQDFTHRFLAFVVQLKGTCHPQYEAFKILPWGG